MVLQREIVLVVEDDALLLYALADDFRDAGFDVLEAMNVEQAIGILEVVGEVAAICTDIDMPGELDGLDLAALVTERWPPIRIVVTSGMGGVVKERLPASSEFISKPYSGTEIVETVKSMLAA